MLKQEHVPRWIKASVDKWMDANRGSFPLYIEGSDRKTNDKTSFFELRVDGPYRTQYTRSEFSFYVEINIETTTAINEEDSHLQARMFGQAMLMLPTCIAVYKYGDGSDDDQTYLGDLQRMDDAQDHGTEVSTFGQVDPNLPLIQGTIEAHYRMLLSEGN